MMPKSEFQRDYHRKTALIDRLMRFLIGLSGIITIISIAVIFYYLFHESLPLLCSETVQQSKSEILKQEQSEIIHCSETEGAAFHLLNDNKGGIYAWDFMTDSMETLMEIPLVEDEIISSSSYKINSSMLLTVGTNQGRILQVILPDSKASLFLPEVRQIYPDTVGIDMKTKPIEHLLLREISNVRIFSWIQENQLYIRVVTDNDSILFDENLSQTFFNQNMTALTMNSDGSQLISGSKNGELFWFALDDAFHPYLYDNWKISDDPILHLDFLAGDVTLVCADSAGNVFSLLPVRDDKEVIHYRQIHQFHKHAGPVSQLVPFPANRSFITVGNSGRIHINHSTSGKTLLEFTIFPHAQLNTLCIIDDDNFYAISSDNHLAKVKLEQNYPEITFSTLFTKTWYEGYNKPAYVWQPVGGSDEYESKFSFIPLLFGSLKGTGYAMVFSLPLALLAALYISQFAPNRLAKIVKPSIEIMSAFPSVIIGFIAGIFLAPYLEKYLLQFLLFFLILPIFLAIMLVLNRKYFVFHGIAVSVGSSIILLLMLVFGSYFISWYLSPLLEKLVFEGNFNQWIFLNFDITYDQRNSILVGFALGFAVIPTVFTLAENSFSSVPKSLITGAIALGASQQQTIKSVILPATSGGIIAAISLGFGRAVGETMIVLMASGNTPLISISPFNGFRTISATLAIEMPEAIAGGTHYRVLFLLGFLLFVFTFLINSLASFIQFRMQKRYSSGG